MHFCEICAGAANVYKRGNVPICEISVGAAKKWCENSARETAHPQMMMRGSR